MIINSLLLFWMTYPNSDSGIVSDTEGNEAPGPEGSGEGNKAPGPGGSGEGNEAPGEGEQEPLPVNISRKKKRRKKNRASMVEKRAAEHRASALEMRPSMSFPDMFASVMLTMAQRYAECDRRREISERRFEELHRERMAHQRKMTESMIDLVKHIKRERRK